LWMLGQSKVAPFSPAAFLHGELGAHAGDSLLAAPIVASLILLAGVLLFVEVLRVIVKHTARGERQRQPLEDVLDSSTPS
jgi:hypothetical protein